MKRFCFLHWTYMAPGYTNRDDNDDDVDNNNDNRNHKNNCQVKLINKLSFSCPQGKKDIFCFPKHNAV